MQRVPTLAVQTAASKKITGRVRRTGAWSDDHHTRLVRNGAISGPLHAETQSRLEHRGGRAGLRAVGMRHPESRRGAGGRGEGCHQWHGPVSRVGDPVGRLPGGLGLARPIFGALGNATQIDAEADEVRMPFGPQVTRVEGRPVDMTMPGVGSGMRMGDLSGVSGDHQGQRQQHASHLDRAPETRTNPKPLQMRQRLTVSTSHAYLKTTSRLDTGQSPGSIRRVDL